MFMCLWESSHFLCFKTLTNSKQKHSVFFLLTLLCCEGCENQGEEVWVAAVGMRMLEDVLEMTETWGEAGGGL